MPQTCRVFKYTCCYGHISHTNQQIGRWRLPSRGVVRHQRWWGDGDGEQRWEGKTFRERDSWLRRVPSPSPWKSYIQFTIKSHVWTPFTSQPQDARFRAHKKQLVGLHRAELFWLLFVFSNTKSLIQSSLEQLSLPCPRTQLSWTGWRPKRAQGSAHTMQFLLYTYLFALSCVTLIPAVGKPQLCFPRQAAAPFFFRIAMVVFGSQRVVSQKWTFYQQKKKEVFSEADFS